MPAFVKGQAQPLAGLESQHRGTWKQEVGWDFPDASLAQCSGREADGLDTKHFPMTFSQCTEARILAHACEHISYSTSHVHTLTHI